MGTIELTRIGALSDVSEPRSVSSILERFCRARDGTIQLALTADYYELLSKLGDPHKKLSPVFHVAGTNGKGSTSAFLRAILESDGKSVHVYTSPHLVSFNERIRVAGALIPDDALISILTHIETLCEPGKVSDFEVTTAAAFVAFSTNPADAVILEVGMGGRLDATNVIPASSASLIARLSFDHCKYLGNTLSEIAREKAGVMRKGVPCYVSAQTGTESVRSLRQVALETGALLKLENESWSLLDEGRGFRFQDQKRNLTLPRPSLVGPHQIKNAGLAVAALSAHPFNVSDKALQKGVAIAEWPGRLQHLKGGRLDPPPPWELWLDGGHNDSAAEVLAQQMEIWAQDDMPLDIIFGMLTTKNPQDFLKPIAAYVRNLVTVPIANEPLAAQPLELLDHARLSGIKNSYSCTTIRDALAHIQNKETRGRILICGSLYLAGEVLALDRMG